MTNENELANVGLWDTLDELTEYPSTSAIQHAMNIVGDAIDRIGIQPVERCAYCDNVAIEICDTCGVSLCNDHVIVGNMVTVGDVNIPYTYCRNFACIDGKRTADIVPYITCA